jgi:hypothetical protein
MDENEKEITRRTGWIMGIILLVLLSGIGGYYIWFQRQQMQEMTEMSALAKESLLDDFEEISLQYEGYKFSVNNDSLIILLTTEQAKVQRLQEELRTVKTTNARLINQYKQEAETLRKIMRNYVIQIDSLNSENEKLKDENKQVTQRYQQASSRVTRLSQELEKQTERVQMASRLDAVNIQMMPINNRGKTAKLDKAEQLMLTFIISKNITAPVGDQTIYVRLMKPNGDVLLKSNYGNFRFENKDIAYSLIKPIEYDGEEQNIVLYWPIGEYLSPGTYRIDIFAGGNQIGRKEIKL